MKYAKQCMIIFTMAFLGEVLRVILPFPIPASIYGIFLMLGALGSGIIKVEDVKETATLLVDLMPVMFIPPSVGLLESWGLLRDGLTGYILISVLSTIAVMITAGKVTQFFMEKKEGKTNE